MSPKSMRAKLSGIRFFYIMARFGDSPPGLRYKHLLKALDKGYLEDRELPFAPEMFRWARGGISAARCMT